MRRARVSREDYLFALGVACLPGAIGVFVLLLADVINIANFVGAGLLIFASGLIVALPWARDALALRLKIAGLGSDEPEPEMFSSRTPLGAAIARQVQESQRRVNAIQRAMEMRAIDAESVIDSLPEPLLILDQRRRILHGNKGAETLFGPRLADRHLAEVLRSPGILEAVEDTISTGNLTAIEFDLHSPVQRTLEARIAPLSPYGSGGEALLLTLHDLTAIRHAEQMRVDFVANVSHELRTPLTSVAGFIETMQTVAADDPDARDRFLTIMNTETQRMNRLVDDLLSLSRIEMEEHNAPEDTVGLQNIIESVMNLMGPLAKEYSVKMRVEGVDRLPPVLGDADQLGQVVRNLVENGIRYGASGGRVIVRGSIDGQMARISVQDFGEGIAPELHHRLTERFYRVEKARSRTVGGTGLGLAIVKHIVNRHRGRLQIESDVGKGCVFSVLLPVADSHTAASSM